MFRCCIINTGCISTLSRLSAVWSTSSSQKGICRRVVTCQKRLLWLDYWSKMLESDEALALINFLRKREMDIAVLIAMVLSHIFVSK